MLAPSRGAAQTARDMAPSADPLASQRVHRIAKATLTVLLVLLGLWVSATFLPALIWAAVIAVAIDPLYTRAECRWPRQRSVLLPTIATTMIALLVLVPLTLGVIEAAREARLVTQMMAQARTTGLPEPHWMQQLPFSGELSRWWASNLGTPEGAQQFQALRGEMLIRHSQLWGKGLLHRAIVFAFTLMALFFVLRDRDSLVLQLKAAGRRLLGNSGDRIGTQLIRSVRGTIDGLVLVGIGEGAVMAVVYLIAGVPHPLLLGLMTAVGAMIPFGAAVLFGVAAAMLVGQSAVVSAVVVFVTGLIVVGIADHFIRPVLIGGATRLPFLWVLIGILGGVETLGLLGLFVGPALMAVLILLWREFIAAGVSGEASPPGSPADPLPIDCG